MRIWTLIQKEFRHLIQAPEAVFLMILFPIAITWILGMALTSASSDLIELPKTQIPLVSQQSEIALNYRDQAAPLGLDFQILDAESAEAGFASGEYTHVVYIEDQRIRQLSSGSENSLENLLIQMYSGAFAQQTNLVNYALQHQRPEVLAQSFENRVSLKGVDERPAPSSFDYYGVTMLTLIMLWGSMQAASLIQLENGNHTVRRLKNAPISMLLLFSIKVVVSLVVLMVQAGIVISVNSLLFGVNYGSISQLMLILLPYGLFSGALGILIELIFSRARAAQGAIMLLINLMLITGGAYVPVEQMGSLMVKLQEFSPVSWVNRAIFSSIYQIPDVGRTGLIMRLLVIALLMLSLSAVLFRRQGVEYVRID